MENSIWAEKDLLPAFPSLKQDLKTDVLIIGGGLAGLLCAHRLTQSGASCVLIEADRLCRGVTRNTTAKITSQHGLVYHKLLREFGEETARTYYRANEAALAQYRNLAQGIDCDLETKDNYIYASGDKAKLDREWEALKRIGIPAKYVDSLSLPLPATGAIRFPGQAQFHPLKFAAGIADGLRIYAHTTARELVGNIVLTDHARITAEKIIVATHFPILNKHGSYFLKMYQQRSYVLALENAGQVDGMYLDGEENGLSLRSWGEYLLLGGGGHRTGKQGGGWAELEACAAKYFPDAKIRCRWATQDCMTLDGMPYIGQYSMRTPNLYVATGFNKWGMSSTMVSAMLLSDLVQGKQNPWAAVFSPSRTMLRTQLAVNAWESTTNLLRISRPRCPHLGCALQWNAQERSWDCPCHGSRFTKEGKLLDNPATDDLKRRN